MCSCLRIAKDIPGTPGIQLEVARSHPRKASHLRQSVPGPLCLTDMSVPQPLPLRCPESRVLEGQWSVHVQKLG